MLRRKLLAMGKNFLAHVIIEVSADMIQKLGITSDMAEEMFLEQAIDLDNTQPKPQADPVEEKQEPEEEEDEEDGPDLDNPNFVLTQIYDVLQVNQGNRTIYALCVKVIDRSTGEPWWLPYRFLKKTPVSGDVD